MSDEIEVLLKNDPLAYSLIQDCAHEFSLHKADRDLLKQTKGQAKQLAEWFLNKYFESSISSSDVQQMQRELEKIRIERKVKNVSHELLEIYKCLKIIRDYSSRVVLLDCAQSAADSLALRAYPTQAIKAVGQRNSVDVQPLIDLINSANSRLGLSEKERTKLIVDRHCQLSRPLFLSCQEISATKVYFTGPSFYSNVGEGYSLTFSTGSGLPDPLEWNGSAWFQEQYNVPTEKLTELGIGDKNPFRSLNFSMGICNPNWKGRRIYVWQESKTASQVQRAYEAAEYRENGARYLYDAIVQLLRVFSTPNLLIIKLDNFPESLSIWTRVSSQDVMISNRPGTQEARIAHGLWFKPRLQISDAAVVTIVAAATAAVEYPLFSSQNDLVRFFSAFIAPVAISYLTYKVAGSPAHKLSKATTDLQESMVHRLDDLWNGNDTLPWVVKGKEKYDPKRAFSKVITTLSRLSGRSIEEVTQVYELGHKMTSS